MISVGTLRWWICDQRLIFFFICPILVYPNDNFSFRLSWWQRALGKVTDIKHMIYSQTSSPLFRSGDLCKTYRKNLNSHRKSQTQCTSQINDVTLCCPIVVWCLRKTKHTAAKKYLTNKQLSWSLHDQYIFLHFAHKMWRHLYIVKQKKYIR